MGITTANWQHFKGKIVFVYDVEYTNKGDWRHRETTWLLHDVTPDGVAEVSDGTNIRFHYAVEQLRTKSTKAKA